ncbi:uncharacterized protein LOC130713681 [Lotus japonicus]|uniref:uncharacterized protein LOC130711739 n=1 Tax=Lotus japonicus TaxID=34305 RepID=UPI00258C9769|nr:uncharacterized protein LOC130711739 [Lotus japonicus]XP_057419458.1 uncharacterized protein LOC130713681 [Lotus japonicus]
MAIRVCQPLPLLIFVIALVLSSGPSPTTGFNLFPNLFSGCLGFCTSGDAKCNEKCISKGYSGGACGDHAGLLCCCDKK